MGSSAASEKGRKTDEPDRHAEQHPRPILLVTFHGSTTPQRVEEIGLHDLDGLVALRGYVEREFPGQVGEFCVELRALCVEPRCDRTD